MASTDSVNDYQKLKVGDLKELLRSKGLAMSGKKEELIIRLKESIQISVSVTTAAAAPTSGDAPVLKTTKTTTKATRKVTAKVTLSSPTAGDSESSEVAPKKKVGVKRPAPGASSAGGEGQPSPAKKERDAVARGLTERVIIDAGELKMQQRQPMRLLSWNVNGLRAVLRKPESAQMLADLVEKEQPHMLALQETKLQEDNVEEVTKTLKTLLPGYTAHWSCSTAKKGYSGTAALIRDGDDPATIPLEVRYGIGDQDGDKEGRTITLKYPFGYVVICYTPNSGEGLKRLQYRTDTWDMRFGSYLEELSEPNGTTPVLVCGDLNCAHEDIDFYNPGAKHVLKQAGLTLEERASFATNLLRNRQFLDTFREQNPELTGVYTYWSVRASNRIVNRGLRLDYWLCSSNCGRHESSSSGGGTTQEKQQKKGADSAVSIVDSYVLDGETVGVSDHCPVGLDIAVTTVSS